MGGCSLIFLMILAIPVLIIVTIALILFTFTVAIMTISGIIIVILAIIIKLICFIQEKNGKDVKSYIKIISTIMLIIGILLFVPIISAMTLSFLHDLNVKRENIKIENLYNKIVVNDHTEWHDQYFILNDKKVVLSDNLYLPENNYFIKKEVAGHIVYKNIKKLSDAFVILKIDNNTNYPMFLVESIDYNRGLVNNLNSSEIFINEDDKIKIQDYYAESKNQVSTIHYVNDKSEYKKIECDFELSDLINLKKHYMDSSESINENDIIRNYYFVVQSEDKYYTDYIAIVETFDNFYLVDNKDYKSIHATHYSEEIYLDILPDERNKIVYKLTTEEEEYVKELINQVTKDDEI